MKMVLIQASHSYRFSKGFICGAMNVVLALSVLMLVAGTLAAQIPTPSPTPSPTATASPTRTPTPTPTPRSTPSPTSSPTATPSPTPPQASTGVEAGGPGGDIGPIAVPKKKASDEPPKKDDVPQAPKKVEGMPNFSMHVSAQLVTLDVGVVTKEGMFVPGLKKEYFRVLE